MDLKEEELLGSAVDQHWYYVSKGIALRSLVKDGEVLESLDIGAGSGVFSRLLLDEGVAGSALCVDPGYAEERSESHRGKEIRFARSLETVDQRLILMMDVLEHVDDDVALLRQYTETMPADGRVVITVPAFQFLWSGHDVFLEHHRRYTRRKLEQVVADAGLEVLDSRYFFGLLFPVAAVVRLVERWRLRNRQIEARSSLTKQSPFVNSLLIAIHRIECRLLFPLNRLAGLTIFCVARRPN